MPDSKFVSVAKPKITGGALRGPITSVLPTDSSTALAATILPVGYVGPGGVKQKADRKSEKFRAWGGAVVHVAQTEFGESYTLTLLESSNADVLKAVYGEANVTVTGTAPDQKIAVKHNELELPAEVWVFDMLMGKKTRRIVLPNAKITSTGDVSYVDSELISYEIEIDAMPDASGNVAYEYVG